MVEMHFCGLRLRGGSWTVKAVNRYKWCASENSHYAQAYRIPRLDGKEIQWKRLENINSDVFLIDLQVWSFRSQWSNRNHSAPTIFPSVARCRQGYCQSAPRSSRRSSDSTSRSSLHKQSHAGHGFCWPAGWPHDVQRACLGKQRRCDAACFPSRRPRWPIRPPL